MLLIILVIVVILVIIISVIIIIIVLVIVIVILVVIFVGLIIIVVLLIVIVTVGLIVIVIGPIIIVRFVLITVILIVTVIVYAFRLFLCVRTKIINKLIGILGIRKEVSPLQIVQVILSRLLNLIHHHSLAPDFMLSGPSVIIRYLLPPSVHQGVEGGQLESAGLGAAVVALKIGDAGPDVTFPKSTVIALPIKGGEFHVVGSIFQLLQTSNSVAKVAAGQLIQVVGLFCIENDEVAVEHGPAVAIVLLAVADVCD